MPQITAASDGDGSSIAQITAAAGIFTPVELDCVEELWNAYRDRGEASGYAFLTFRGDG